MSYLARELDRQLVWIDGRARELQTAVEQLISEANALTNGYTGWDDEQADFIRRAIADWGDNCGRSIAHAHYEITQFREQLMQAR